MVPAISKRNQVNDMKASEEKRRQRGNNQIAEGDEAAGQRIDDPADQAGEDKTHENQESVLGAEIFKFPGHFSRQEGGNNFGAVHGRDGNQVEEGEPYIVFQNPEKKLRTGLSVVAAGKEDDQEKDAEEADKKVHARAGKGNEKGSFPPVFIVVGVDHDGFGPAEAADDQKNGAQDVQMGQRIDGEASHGGRRGVSQTVRHGCMGIFMEGEGNQKGRHPEKKRGEAQEIRHGNSF